MRTHDACHKEDVSDVDGEDIQMGYNMRILDSPVRRAMSSLTESITQSTQKRKTRQAKAAETSQSKCNDNFLNEVGKVVGVVTGRNSQFGTIKET